MELCPRRFARVGSHDLRLILQTVLRPVQAKGFVVLPKRWIVERTFSWLVRDRRLARTKYI
jgi:putative transposase